MLYPRGRTRRPVNRLIADLSFARVRRDAIERLSEHEVRWRALGALFIAGGVMAGVSLLLPVDPGSHILPIALVCTVAVITGLFLAKAAKRLPQSDAWLGLVLSFGTVLITLGVVFNHNVASPYALIYVWVGFDGFFFLGRRAAFANLGWVGFNYGLALALTPAHGQAQAGRWLVLIGTVGVIGVLADILRSRSEALISRLSEVARTDSLTGLLNRRGFEQRLEDELRRVSRTGGSVSLVVADLDHFKLVNDRFGHHIGDEALRKFSALVVQSKRSIDGAGRIGGEEFALVLPDTDWAGAHALAERLRRSVRDALAEYGLPLSVSLGVATYPRHGRSTEELLRRADQAMYLAKRLGRDRSIIYSDEVSQTLEGESAESPAKMEHVPAVLILAETLDLRDTGTALHSQTVGRYAEMIASALELAEDRVKRIRLAGLLHDIGKIGVPDPILCKPGRLDAREWEEMKKHPELGARILAGANLDDVSGWVLAHHERPDGRGYPLGLLGDEIPLEAKILAVADAFEAMTAERIYSPPLPVGVAITELQVNAGTQFDAEIVATFVAQLSAESGREPVAAAAR